VSTVIGLFWSKTNAIPLELTVD